jgi:PAS domain S-box-containing protein
MNGKLQETLRQLFDQVSANPESLPTVPAETWPEGSEEWQLLSSFRSMLCAIQQSKHTAYKQAEEQLREREAQYRSIFEATSDGMVIRTLDGVAVEANPAACQMHGYTYREFLGLPRIAIVHPDSYPIAAAFWHGIQTRGEFCSKAVDLRKDGTPMVHLFQ